MMRTSFLLMVVLIAVFSLALVGCVSQSVGLAANQAVPGQDQDTNQDTYEEEQVRDTILRARRIQLEAEYTFDASRYPEVYINDPRGGEISPEALALVREIRQDPSLPAEQVGNLDVMLASVANLKLQYELYINELRRQEAAGMLSEYDRLVLEAATNGAPSPDLEPVTPAPPPTQCYTYWPTEPPYPPPQSPPYAPGELVCGPGATPTPRPLTAADVDVPYRGTDPAWLPAEAFALEFASVEIEGDVARAVVHFGAGISEMVLVKVEGTWYIAGGRLLESGL
jgi:hypothetical protein